MAEELKSVKLSTPWIPYVSNVTADYVTDASQVAELLKQQVSSPVQFTQSIERMIADGVDTFIEIGPGRHSAVSSVKLTGMSKYTISRNRRIWTG